MGDIDKEHILVESTAVNKCKKCGKEYTNIRDRCPYCHNPIKNWDIQKYGVFDVINGKLVPRDPNNHSLDFLDAVQSTTDPYHAAYECPHCGYTYQGMLLYCPNCHSKMTYDSGINPHPINNWQAAWGKEPTVANGLSDFGCGCMMTIGGIILLIIIIGLII